MLMEKFLKIGDVKIEKKKFHTKDIIDVMSADVKKDHSIW